jgi:cytochrome c553
MIRTTALAVLLAASFPAFAQNRRKQRLTWQSQGNCRRRLRCLSRCRRQQPDVGESHHRRPDPRISVQAAEQLQVRRRQTGRYATTRSWAAWWRRCQTKTCEPVGVFFSAEDEAFGGQGRKTAGRRQDAVAQGRLRKGVPACAGCHGPAGAGLPVQYPRLAGQYAEYTASSQLKTFRSHERANDAEKVMRMIAGKLSDSRSTLSPSTLQVCARRSGTRRPPGPARRAPWQGRRTL